MKTGHSKLWSRGRRRITRMKSCHCTTSQWWQAVSYMELCLHWIKAYSSTRKVLQKMMFKMTSSSFTYLSPNWDKTKIMTWLLRISRQSYSSEISRIKWSTKRTWKMQFRRISTVRKLIPIQNLTFLASLMVWKPIPICSEKYMMKVMWC